MASKPTLRSVVHSSIATLTTIELADALLDEYDELIHRFDLGDFRPSELNGARFAEAAFRICEHACICRYTPINKTLPRVDQLIQLLEQTPSKQADVTFRIHIPRALRLIYDLRNKRDVAHLGAGVSPNFSDANLVLACASWVTTEIVRISYQCDIAEAQKIVDNLVQRRTSLVWTEGDIVRILNPKLQYRDQVLLILHHLQPDWIEDEKLCKWVDYSNISTFRKNVLKQLHNNALVHYESGKVKILPPGNLYVDNELG